MTPSCSQLALTPAAALTVKLGFTNAARHLSG